MAEPTPGYINEPVSALVQPYTRPPTLHDWDGTPLSDEQEVTDDERTITDLRAEVERLRERVGELEEDSEFLRALRNAGVDNWSGYDYALDIVAEWKREAGAES